ncbi:MAG: hypothetical protein IRZ32_00220 [Solirubrobacteraceae bacterium]|nr:hypothetical protein [Solirubrobacteraceae bacterium]
MVTLTLDLRACSPDEGRALVAGLGLRTAPVGADSWFPAHAPLEDEALRSLLLARVAACSGAADPGRAYLDHHAALVAAAVEDAVARLRAVPPLHDAELRIGPRGLPEAIALGVDGWVAGADAEALRALAAERVDEHLAPLTARLG